MSNTNSTKKTGREVEVSDDQSELVEARELTAMQAAFVQAFVDGPTAGNSTTSAIVAGYSEKSAPSTGCVLKKLPHVATAIDAAMRDAISQGMTAKALRVAKQILDDEDASLRLRGEIAMKVIDYSGLVQRAQTEKAKQTGLDGGKKLGELSRDELENLVRNGAALMRAAAHLPPANAIEGSLTAPNTAPPEAQAAE